MKNVTFEPPDSAFIPDDEFAKLLAVILGQSVTVQDRGFIIDGVHLSRSTLDRILPELIQQTREAWKSIVQQNFEH